MSQFDDTIADYGTDLLFEHSGDEATFAVGNEGAGSACVVILAERDSRDESRDGELYRTRVADLVVRPSQAVAVPGDAFTVAGVVWVVVRQSSRDPAAITYDVENYTKTGNAAGDYQEVL